MPRGEHVNHSNTRDVKGITIDSTHSTNVRVIVRTSMVGGQCMCSIHIAAEPKCPQGRAYVEFTGKFLQCGEGLGTNSCPQNYECIFDGLVHGCCPSKCQFSHTYTTLFSIHMFNATQQGYHVWFWLVVSILLQ